MKVEIFKDSAPVPRKKKKKTIRLTVRIGGGLASDYQELGRVERRKVPSLCRAAINSLIKKLKHPAL